MESSLTELNRRFKSLVRTESYMCVMQHLGFGKSTPVGICQNPKIIQLTEILEALENDTPEVLNQNSRPLMSDKYTM